VDRIGERYGTLVVKRKVYKYKSKTLRWECWCDCGHALEVSTSVLSKKGGKHRCPCGGVCGSGKAGDLVGKKVGKLTPLSCKPKTEGQWKGRPRWFWTCMCDCGRTTEVRKDHLLSGLTISCGCVSNQVRGRRGEDHPHWRGVGELSRSRLNRIKKGAKLRGLPFEVTDEYLWKLFLTQDRRCALTGLPLKFESNRSEEETTASLDRVCSSSGYTVGNVQWVHKVVNRLKMDMPDDELIYWACRIAEFRGGESDAGEKVPRP
jgi:hypothetical protein